METISTLRYASRAKNIQNRTHVNEEPKDALLRHFQEEIAELRRQVEEGCFDIGSCDELDEEGENVDIEIEEIEENTENEGKKEKKKKSKKGDREKADIEKELLEKKAKENEQELNRAK